MDHAAEAQHLFAADPAPAVCLRAFRKLAGRMMEPQRGGAHSAGQAALSPPGSGIRCVLNSAALRVLQAFRKLAGEMVEGRPSEPGPPPPNLVAKQWSLLPPVVIDSTPFGEISGVPQGFRPTAGSTNPQSLAQQHTAQQPVQEPANT